MGQALFKKIFRRWKANGKELTASTAAQKKKKKKVVWCLGVCQAPERAGGGGQERAEGRGNLQCKYWVWSGEVGRPLLSLFLFGYMGLYCFAWAFSRCSEHRLLLIAVHGLLIAVVPLVAEHGL